MKATVTNIGEVPDGEPLVVEALLLNRDAGFVCAGMAAVIKLEAYPFTRYGVLHAWVERVSPDATVDQQRGLVFPIRIKPSTSDLDSGAQHMILSPGIAVSAEVRTGSRRVIEYLRSPIARTMTEAGKREP